MADNEVGITLHYDHGDKGKPYCEAPIPRGMHRAPMLPSPEEAMNMILAKGNSEFMWLHMEEDGSMLAVNRLTGMPIRKVARGDFFQPKVLKRG